MANAKESSVPDPAALYAMRQFRVDSRSLKVSTQGRLCVRHTFLLRRTHVNPHVSVTLIYNKYSHVANEVHEPSIQVVFSYNLHMPEVSPMQNKE